MSPLPPFQTLLDHHGESVWRYLVARLGPEDAADLYQDTMLTALRAYAELTHADNLRAWLFRVARSRVVDAWRVRHPVPVPRDQVATPPVPDAETEALARLTDPQLWSAVQGLPEAQREALLLRVVGDLPHREVAALLGCTEVASRQRVHAALTRLRKELADG